MDQAMDQLKEFLRQCIKYRFWISVGVAALFSTIAYFLGAGPVQAKANKEAAAIKQAADGVKPFTVAGIPNAQYKPIVDEKTEIVTKDVNTAWKQLYNRQAPCSHGPRLSRRGSKRGDGNGPRTSPPAPSSLPRSTTSSPTPSMLTKFTGPSILSTTKPAPALWRHRPRKCS